MSTASNLPGPALGWPLLPLPESGELRYPSFEQSVRQSIQIILLTRPGEQLMRPQFGGGLEKFLFEPNTILTRRRIRDQIMESLQRWEKRITVTRVEVAELADHPGRLRVEIGYQLNRTGALFTLGLSLDLDS